VTISTRRLTIEDPATEADRVREAAEALAEGRLVVFPTETVYGVGASAADPAALAALSRLKNRPPEKPFSLHLAEPSEAPRWAGPLPRPAAALARKLWPGPVTLVVPDRRDDQARAAGPSDPAVYHKGMVGLRCPDHPVASAILREAGVPVAATSANPRGLPPPLSAQEAADYLDGQVAVLVDGGPTRHQAASTVVRVEADGRLSVLREGAVAAHRVRRLARTTLLFVCTGNLCRSPMAAGLARKFLAERLGCRPEDLGDRGFEVASAGTGAGAGASASAHAVRAAAERGVDIRSHRSQPVTVDLLRSADYIFVMTEAHRRAVEPLDPGIGHRIALLDPEGGDIPDPIGGDLEVYRDCAERLERAVAHRIEEVLEA